MSRIDADRLMLPLNLLDKAASIIPCCIGQISSEGDYHDIQHAIELLEMARDELHRLQAQAMETAI